MLTVIPIVASLLSTAVAATPPPPETCDPVLIDKCLNRFEVNFNSCDSDDLRCQCTSVIQEGANCYAVPRRPSLNSSRRTVMASVQTTIPIFLVETMIMLSQRRLTQLRLVLP